MCSSGHTHRAVIALRHYRRELRQLCGQSEYFCEPVPLRVDIIRLCDNCQESCARLAALAVFWFSDSPSTRRTKKTRRRSQIPRHRRVGTVAHTGACSGLSLAGTSQYGGTRSVDCLTYPGS